MKRYTYSVLLCILLVILAGCSLNTEEVTFTKQPDQSRTIPNDPRLNTREEIESFSKSELAPAGFVMPEDLRILGEVSDVVIFLPGKDGYTYRRYLYSGVDQNDVEFTVGISHYGFPGVALSTNLEITQQEFSASSGMTDMTKLEERKSGWIVKNNARYFYTKGKLTSVIIYANGIEFDIKYYNDGKPYPMNEEDTWLCKVLSLDNAKATSAVNEFRWAIFSRDIWKWLILAGAVVALGATGFVIWKKKKRKATVNKADELTTEPQPQPADPLE